MPLLGILALLLVIAGAGYAGWTYRDRIARRGRLPSKTYLANLTNSDTGAGQNRGERARHSGTASQPASHTGSGSKPRKPASQSLSQNLTQRLLPDGQEINPGPANDTPSIGRGHFRCGLDAGSSRHNRLQAQGQQQAAGQAQPPAALPIGQKAFFYEERSGQDAGTADAGGVVWSVVQESPGNDLPPEPAIRAEVTIPDRGINLRMIIRRNGDKSLPASHLVEMIFTVPEGFAGRFDR